MPRPLLASIFSSSHITTTTTLSYVACTQAKQKVQRERQRTRAAGKQAAKQGAKQNASRVPGNDLGFPDSGNGWAAAGAGGGTPTPGSMVPQAAGQPGHAGTAMLLPAAVASTVLDAAPTPRVGAGGVDTVPSSAASVGSERSPRTDMGAIAPSFSSPALPQGDLPTPNAAGTPTASSVGSGPEGGDIEAGGVGGGGGSVGAGGAAFTPAAAVAAVARQFATPPAAAAAAKADAAVATLDASGGIVGVGASGVTPGPAQLAAGTTAAGEPYPPV